MTKTFINAGVILQTEERHGGPLRGSELSHIPSIHNGYIRVQDGRILDIGPMTQYSIRLEEEEFDLNGRWVYPTWCDSHTHAVFPYYRSHEWKMRLQGMSYSEIAERGGGILNSANALAGLEEDKLYNISKNRVLDMIRKGCGALEIKSGYGLTHDAEKKMLRVIQRLKKDLPIPIRSTFLGLHALPAEYKGKKKEYVGLMCNTVLPDLVQDGLVDYVDVFCEKGFFEKEDVSTLLVKASELGIPAKIHSNQFYSIGGIQAAISGKAKSVDHLEVMTDQDIHDLALSSTMGCILPIAPFFLNDPYPPARQMVDQGVAIALATDFNPGSAPSYDMVLAMSLACLKCGLLPEEAFNAATINGAYAMDSQAEVGSLSIGKRANFIISDPLKDISELAYRICSESNFEVIIDGEVFG